MPKPAFSPALLCGFVCAAILSAGLGVFGATAQEQEPPQAAPLSAIDWLRLGAGQATPGAYPLTPPSGPVDGTDISVRALDALRPEAVGLFPASRVGLPASLWGPTPADVLADLIRVLPADMLPALRDLSLRLLLAEFNAPLPESGSLGQRAPRFLLARVDKLIDFGALDQAAAILDALEDIAAEGLVLRPGEAGLAEGHLFSQLDYFAMLEQGREMMAARPALSDWFAAMVQRAAVIATRPDLNRESIK